MSRPTIPGGAFVGGGIPTVPNVDDYIQSKGDARYANKVATDMALAGKADNAFPLSGATDTKTVADWIAEGIDRPSIEGTEFIHLDHRGSSQLYPENTLEAFRQAYADGSRWFETDCYLLADGSLGIMHDSTVDRTTTATGAVSALNAAQFKALVCDWHTAIGAENVFQTIGPLPLLGDILTEFKGRVVWVLEAKSAGAGAAIVKLLQAIGIAKDQVIIEAGPGLYTELDAARSAGFETLYIPGSPGNDDMAAIWNAGTRWIGCTVGTQSDATIQAYIDYGFQVFVNIVAQDRRYQRDFYKAKGPRGVYTDDPAYLRSAAPLWTSDPFKRKIWAPGHRAQSGAMSAMYRGRFTSTGRLALTDTTQNCHILMGGACPIKGETAPTDFSIYFKVKWNSATDATRWAAVFLADDSMADRQFDSGAPGTGAYGYHFLVRKNGVLDIYSYAAGVATNRGTSTLNTAIADAEEASYRITVTPTAVSLTRLNATTGAVMSTVSYTDAAYRGGYFHIGHQSSNVEFYDIFVV